MATLPKFAQLPVVGQTGERHVWDVFGRDDQLGTINLITPEHVKRATSLVRSGKVINLDLPLNFPSRCMAGFVQRGINTTSRLGVVVVMIMSITSRYKVPVNGTAFVTSAFVSLATMVDGRMTTSMRKGSSVSKTGHDTASLVVACCSMRQAIWNARYKARRDQKVCYGRSIVRKDS